MEEAAAINQFFDPRCKFQWIEFILSEELGKAQAATTLNLIKASLSTWFNKVILNKNKSIAKKVSSSNPEAIKATNTDGLTTLDEDNQRFEQYLEEKKVAQSVSMDCSSSYYTRSALANSV